MSMENTKEFMKKIVENEALQERLLGKEPAEVLAVARELGLECTWEELEDAAKSMELSPNEMEQASGGWELWDYIMAKIAQSDIAKAMMPDKKKKREDGQEYGIRTGDLWNK